jgi:GABA permease
VCVPASPIETGQAAVNGPLKVWDATAEAARERLEYTLETLTSEDLDVTGELGDYRPLRALSHAVETFRPDQIVIATRPLEDSVWQRYDVVDRARSTYPIPVTHVIAKHALATQAEDA